MTTTSEPVALNGLLSIAAALVTPLLAKWGIDNGGAQSLFAGIGALATALLSIWGVVRARAQVTPVAAPKDNTGTPLVAATPPATPPVPPTPTAG